MFYCKSEIDDVLKCPSCHDRFFEPYSIPCGESLCDTCISNVLDENEKGFKCPICSEFHEKPPNGFPKNKTIIKLIEKKYAEVYRNKDVKSLKEYLEKIKSNTTDLIFSLNYSKDKIKEYCLNLRMDIQLVTECKINLINKFNEEFIGIINKYEKECIEKLDKVDVCKQEYEEVKIEMDNFHSKWTDYLNNFEINDDDVLKASGEAKVLVSKLNEKETKLKMKIFDRKYVCFEGNEKDLDQSVVGRMFFKSIASDEKLNFGKFKSIKLQYSSNQQVAVNLQLNLLNEDKYLASYLLDNQLYLTLLNSQGTTTKNNTFYHQQSYTATVYNKIVNACDEKILVFAKYTYNNGYSSYNNGCSLTLYDSNLSYLKEVQLGNGLIPNKIASNKSSIFLLFNSSISVYDWDLQKLRDFDQNNNPLTSLPWPNNIVNIHAKEDTLFLLDNSHQLYVFNTKDNELISKFKISQNEFIYDKENSIVTFDPSSKIIKSYDLNEFSVELELQLKNCNNSLSLVDIIDGVYYFFDASNNTLYFN